MALDRHVVRGISEDEVRQRTFEKSPKDRLVESAAAGEAVVAKPAIN